MKNTVNRTLSEIFSLFRFVLLSVFIINTQFVVAQNAIVGAGFSSGWGGACGSNSNFTYFSASSGTSYTSGALTPNGTGNQYWRIGVDWGGTIKQVHINTSGTDVSISPNVTNTLNSTCVTSGAMYINVASTNYRYVFKTKDAGATPSYQFVLFEIQGTTVQTVSSVSQSPNTSSVVHGDAVTVTATLSGSFSTGQAVYLRYSTDNFSTSTVVTMSGSGTSYSATIPSSTNTSGTTVKYYLFTSGTANVATNGSNADFYTINLNNNGGANYSYTVGALSAPTSQSATAASSSQVDLNWTRNGTYQNVIVIVRAGSAPNDLTQGSAYTQGSGDINTAAGYILYKGNTDYSSTALNHTGLSAATAYYYKFFTVNNDYYSSAVSANATTSAVTYTTAQDGDWNTAATWTGSAVPPLGATCTINHAVTVNGTVTNSAANVTISSGKSLDFGASGALTVTGTLTNTSGTLSWSGAGTLTIGSGGTISNAGTVTAGSGNVVFSGAGTISGGTAITFNNLTLNGAATLTTVPTINGTLQLNSGASVSAAPTYGNSSTLTYNASFSVGNEWTATTDGAAGSGRPNNVTISSGTLTISAARAMAGNLTIGSGTGLTTNTSGDLYIRGNWVNNGGTYTPNSKAVFFTGSSTQTITKSGGETFAYLIVDVSSHTVQLGSDVTVNASSGDPLQLLTGDIDLNSFILTLSGTGGNIKVNGAARSITGTGTLSITGGTKTVTSTSSGTLSTGANVNVTLANGLNCGASLTTINGTLQINSGGFVSTNPPIYGTGSTLKYNSTGTYGRNIEWNATSGAGYPYHVQISNSTTLDLGANGGGAIARQMAGNLTIDNGSTFTMANTAMSASLTVVGNVVVGGGTSGTLVLSGSVGGDLAVKGNFTLNTGATLTNNSRAITFNGTSQQQITGSVTFAYLTLNNNNGVLLNNSITINNTCTLTSGKVTMGANSVTISSGGGISGASSSNYFITDGNGYLIMQVAGSEVTFPIGTSSNYAPAFITQAGTSENISARVKSSIDNTLGDATKAVTLQWTLNESNTGNNNITTKFQWNASNEGGSFGASRTSAKIGHYTGSGYTRRTATVGGSDPYTASAASYTSNLSAVAFVVGLDECFDAAYVTTQNGDWNTASTWLAGSVPPAGASCTIDHAVTVTQTALYSVSSITVNSGKSLTFDAEGELTATTTLTNNGTITMTNGGRLTIGAGGSLANGTATFTAGSGTVIFSGSGTISGTIAFNNVEINGAVNFGTASTINGTLTINSGGSVSTNYITYGSSSTLKYNTGASANVSFEWKTNASSGAGVPQNVELSLQNTQVTHTAATTYTLLGNLTIGSGTTLVLSSSVGGDLEVKGNFTSYGTLTLNSRQITFNGTSSQILTGSLTLSYVVLNNSNGLQVNGSVAINNSLTFTSGKITITSGNLTFASAMTLSGNDATKYVVTSGTGYLIRNVGGSEVTFPIGTATSYAPAYLTQAGTAENIGVRVQSTIETPLLNTHTVNLQWTLNESTAGSNTLTTKFQWNAGDEGASFNRAGTVSIAHYIGGYSTRSTTPAGSNPYTTSAGSYSSNLSSVPFIVANDDAIPSGTYTTAADGNWSNTATWTCACIPPSGVAISINHNVTLNQSANVGNLTIATTKTLTSESGQARTLTFGNGSTFTLSGTGAFTANDGKIDFNSNGTVSGTVALYNVDISGAVNFGASATINGTLKINGGGSVLTNFITYGSSSTLQYYSGGYVTRGTEWKVTSSSGAGVPANVVVSNNTSLILSAEDVELYCKTLTIDNGSMVVMNTGSNKSIIATDDVTINGTLTMSDTDGGDLKLGGDLTQGSSGVINWGGSDGRAVFFTGGVEQNITGVTDIPFILVENGSDIKLNNNLETDGAGTNFISFSNGAVVNLNGYSLTFAGTGNIDLNSGSVSTTGGGKIRIVGGTATITECGTFTLGSSDTLSVLGGALNFSSCTTVNGVIEILGTNASLSNNPTYSTTGVLLYNVGTTVTAGGEWSPNLACAAPISIYNIEIANGSTVKLNQNKYIYGELIVDGDLDLNGFTINYQCGCNISSVTYNSTITYNKSGSYSPGNIWSSGTPACKVIIRKGNLQISDTRTVTNSMTLKANASLEVQGSGNMTIGSLSLLSTSSGTASLLQNGTLTISGTSSMERYMTEGKFHMVSSPLSAVDTSKLVVTEWGAINSNFYYYDEAHDDNPNTSWLQGWTRPRTINDATLDVAKGYALYSPKNRSYSLSGGSFNNGNIEINVTNTQSDELSYGWNLIGNPYPSAVDAISFINANIKNTGTVYKSIEGTLYFWDDDGSQGSGYSSSDYASWNGTGSQSPAGGGDIPNGKIGSGQGFFVKRPTDATDNTVRFTNAMRSTTNTQFFKDGVINQPQRVRLQFINNRQQKNNTLIGFLDGATLLYDSRYDGEKLRGNSDIAFYSLLQDKELAIQGLPTIHQADSVQPVKLGFFSNVAGTHTITLTALENWDIPTPVILEDRMTGIFTDMRNQKSYTFTTEKGTYNNRFVVHFSNITTQKPNDNTTDVVYMFDGGTIWVTPKEGNINVQVTDIMGRTTQQVEVQKNNSLQLNTQRWATGVYLVEMINTATGEKKVEKILVQ